MKIVLYHPQIPQNTGNIVRTCSVTGTGLILVKPLGFQTNDKKLKRAGLDYWEGVDVSIIEEEEFLHLLEEERIFFYSSKASKLYTDVKYQKNDLLIFGSESEGLPKNFFQEYPDQFCTIPQRPDKRCLNLATSAGIVVFEAWRQLDYAFND